MLRQPLEEGAIRVARSGGSVVFPARFLLVAAMNPCPCGEREGVGSCRCTPARLERYARRLSGPLLDRFDLHVPVGRPEVEEILGVEPAETSVEVSRRVARVREAARRRGVAANAALSAADLERVAPLTARGRAVLERHLRAGSLSARGLDRVRRVAVTIADLAGDAGPLDERHLAMALELRAGRLGLLAGEGRP